jgi:uncharacterized protein YndB with AHSA1/START domain
VQSIEIRAEVPAPREEVWKLLTDYEGWPEWSDLAEVVVRHPGDPAPGGLGAIRVIRSRGLALQEEVTSFEPPARTTYTLTEGLPVRDYQGEVRLSASPAGTELLWSVTFRPRIPGTGWLLRRLVEASLRALIDALRARLSSATCR